MKAHYNEIKKEYTIRLDDFVAIFYEKIAKNVNLPVETVLADTLLKTAGELAERIK